MAVVSRPMKQSRRIALPSGVRSALSSLRSTALIYILLLVLGYLLLTPVFAWGQRRICKPMGFRWYAMCPALGKTCATIPQRGCARWRPMSSLWMQGRQEIR